MSLTVRVVGLEGVKRMLGADFAQAMDTALKAVALEVENTIKPYGASGIWNSPSNPGGRWYERGYGPKWITRNGVRGRKTSEMLGRSWHVEHTGVMRWRVFTNASYAPFLHSKVKQVRWAGERGWISDEAAVREVVDSGKASRIIERAVKARMRK